MPGTNLNSAMTANSPILWIRETEPKPTGPNGYAYAITAACTGVPPTTAGLFRNGCNMVRLDSTGNVNYQNTGTIASPVWSAYDSAAGGPIPLSTNKIFVGVAGVATEKTLGATFAGTPATVSPTATSSTPTFTGTSPVSSLNLGTPAFSGTGLTAAGQVITTTDNQTMTLNQCAGMWLIPATGSTPPNLILSNTAVAGAPAVLTVQGSANTDAGVYKIVKGFTPIGTISTPTITVTGASYTPAGTNTPTYT